MELLVAITILGMFSLLSYRGLVHVLDGAHRLKVMMERENELARAWAWLDAGLSHTLYFRLPPSPPEARFRQKPDPSGLVAEFWRPVSSPSLPPQRILLSLDGGVLHAHMSSIGRQSDDSPVPVLQGVKRVHLRALDTRLQATATWPVSTDSDALPAAIEFGLYMEDGRVYRRVFTPR